jgi:hypothetical protein
MAAIDRLIEDLRAEGSVDSQGRFTLDREQARAKMQKFQLVDARRYVLELVQAAVLRDATHVNFEIDATDMHMSFDGSPFAAAEIDDLYGSLFADGDTRALRGVRQLALALNAALGMAPKQIAMRSGAVELRMSPGQRDEIIGHEQPVDTTTIHVRQRLSTRVFVDFFRNLTGFMAEEQYLRDHCMYSTVPVTLDNQRISFGIEAGYRGLARLTVVGRDFRGVMKIVDRADFCELRLVKDGVWIDSRELRGCGTHLIAVIEGENLRKDVSQAKIVATAALERIESSLRQLRWKLWKLAFEQLTAPSLRERVEAMLREQLLAHARLDELQEIEEAVELSAHVTWADCRGRSRRISLRELVELTAAGTTVRYSQTRFPEMVADGAPILLLHELEDRGQLAKLLGRELVAADSLLDREHRRQLGQQAFLARVGKPELPGHLDFLARWSIAIELPSGPVRGELGIDGEFLRNPNNKAASHLFMYTQGRLLGRAEIDLGFLNLWLAVEAGFEPNDDFNDALRNPEFVAILLHSIASLREPLVQLLTREQDARNVALLRGLVKRWLIALVDPKAQAGLLTLAGVDTTSRSVLTIDELLPGLLDAGEGLAVVPLFDQLEGPRLSLAQLRELIGAQESIPYVEERPDDPRLVAPNVLVTGAGDRKILRALFDEQAIVRWDPGAKQRELTFWQSERKPLADLRLHAEGQITKTGAGLADWLIDLPEGPIRGFVMLFMLGVFDDDEHDSLRLEIRHTQRPLCTVELDTPFGPLIAHVEHPGLQPSPSWDDVVRDAAFEQVVAAVRTASYELYRRACAGLERNPGTARRALARALLHGAASDPELAGIASAAPLLTTVNGRRLSLTRAAELVARDGKLEFVGHDVGQAPIDDPPVIVTAGSELDELRTLLGDVLVDARDRVRHHRVYDMLATRPELREAKLDPTKTLVRLRVQGTKQNGEVGISCVRTEPGLALRLGVAGREVDLIALQHGFALPIDAVVIDEELPLDPAGKVNARDKRMIALIRQCRRRVPELVIALCNRWPELEAAERALAWPILLRHIVAEAKQERRQIREQAYAAAAAVPGFRDVRGRQLSLAAVLEQSRPRAVEVLVGEQFRQLELDLPALERPIVLADPLELECLQTQGDVRELDAVWDGVLARARSLVRAPEVTTPNIDKVAIAYRKAMVAGGLECELWIPRDVSLFDSMPELIFVQAGRELGRGRLCDSLPSAGIIRGNGLVDVELDDRQQSSLERQLVILYTELATRFAGGQVSKADHERAFEYLAWAVHKLDGAGLSGHGKHARALEQALERVVPPSLRSTVRSQTPAEPGPAPEPEIAPAPAPKPEPVAAPPPAAPKHHPTVATTPEQRLLAGVYEQLHWARSRHALLDELLLNHLQLVAGGSGELASLDRGTLALNREHPIIARLLGQDPHDPIDLAFLLAALYSLINYQAEEISDDDERMFVAQLAETLALSYRSQRGP